MDLVSTPVSIPLVGTIQIFTASPIISTIVSILDSKASSTSIVEPKVQLSTIILSKRKWIEEDIDLDEEIEIPKWDMYNITMDKMHIVGELLQKKAK